VPRGATWRRHRGQYIRGAKRCLHLPKLLARPPVAEPEPVSGGSRVTRQIVLNAFDMNCVTHIVAGNLAAPGVASPRATRISSIGSNLAKLLERGLFDGLFIADVLGIYDVYGGGPEAACGRVRKCR